MQFHLYKVQNQAKFIYGVRNWDSRYIQGEGERYLFRRTERNYMYFSTWVVTTQVCANSCDNWLIKKVFKIFMYLWFVENCIFEKKGYLNLLMIVSESRCVSFLIAVTNHHDLCGLSKQIYSLTALDTTSPRSVLLG